MARRKIYTAEDAKYVKHLYNRMYYLKSKITDSNDVQKWGFRYSGFRTTFKALYDQRALTDDECYALKDLWGDEPHTYDTDDFRQVAVDHSDDYRDLINDISERLDYGSIDDYEKWIEYDTAKFIYDEYRRLAKEI